GWLPPNTRKVDTTPSGEPWCGTAEIRGSDTTTVTWWQNLYYNNYLETAEAFNDPASEERYYNNDDSKPDNINVSYGLSGLGANNDS
ncbi:hypothetical protein R0K05_21905, partial [Planococcus sp. SIMBA_160]